MDRTGRTTVLIAARSSGLRSALTRLLTVQCPTLRITEVDDEYMMLRALVEAPPDVVVLWGSFLAGDRARALQSVRVIAPATRWILITGIPESATPRDPPGMQSLAASEIDRLPEVLRGGVTALGGVGSDRGRSSRDGHGQGDATARAG